MVGYMAWEARTVDVTELTIEGAPGGIIFIADPHLKTGNVDHVRGVIQEINQRQPSVVLIGGDFANGEEENFSLHEVWREIDAPVYAVLGNHDYRTGTNGIGGLRKMLAVSQANLTAQNYDTSALRDDQTDTAFADALEEVLEKNGVTVLRNEYVDLAINGTPVRIVGVDDGWAGMARPPEISGTDAFTIYMIHEPSCRADWDTDLILAGHTHGGQFMVPVVGQLNAWNVVELSGLKAETGSTPTYITRGICGSSVGSVDLRFNSRPEIVLINPPSSAVIGVADGETMQLPTAVNA
ncbi:MAG: metallophosphoesterase [Methanobacteriota archaeon]|nr:MAG: metallophosphoesterase [Euryarchaeota archaeon]